MAYTRVNWQDYPNTSTPINAANLNKMDAEIATLDTKITNIESDYTSEQDVDNAISNALTDYATKGYVNTAISEITTDAVNIVKLADGTTSNPTAINFSNDYASITFKMYILALRNNIRTLQTVCLPRVTLPTTSQCDYSNQYTFDDYAHSAKYDALTATCKIDDENHQCQLKVSNGYIATLYGVY